MLAKKTFCFLTGMAIVALIATVYYVIQGDLETSRKYAMYLCYFVPYMAGVVTGLLWDV